MFNIITKFYNMLGEIIGYGNIKKKKCNKMHGGYTANDEKSDDFDNISEEGGGIGGEGSKGGGGIGGEGSKGGGGIGGEGSDGCKGGGGIGGEGSSGSGDRDRGGGYDNNTVMVDGLELILLKILKL